MIQINLFITIIYILTCWYLFIKDSKRAPFWIYVCIMQAWSLVSCFYNDIGIYNPELFRFTHESYATTWLALLYIAFNFGYWVNFGCKKQLKVVNYSNFFTQQIFIRKSAKLFFLILTFYVFAMLMKYGIPVLEGLDRIEIQKNKNQFELIIENYFLVFIFLLGMLRDKLKKFTWNDILFITYLFYFISSGHKFSGLLDVSLNYFVAIWIRWFSKSDLNKIDPIKILFWLFIFLSLFAVIVYMHYLNITGSASGAIEELFSRLLALQGHVWWSVQNDIDLYGLYDNLHWQSELFSVLYPDQLNPDSFGMRYLMLNMLGDEVASKIFERGYLYTMAYPAILVATFPYVVVFVTQVIVGYFFSAILNYLTFCVENNLVYRSIIIWGVIIPFVNTLGSGVLNVIMTFGVLIKLVVLYLMDSNFIAKAYRHEKIF